MFQKFCYESPAGICLYPPRHLQQDSRLLLILCFSFLYQGFKTDRHVKVLINGVDGRTNQVEVSSDGSIYISTTQFSVTETHPENSVLNAVEIADFAEPVYGAHPDFEITLPEGSLYHLSNKAESEAAGYPSAQQSFNGIWWWDESAGRYMSPNDTFTNESTDNYHAMIALAPNLGCTFGSAPTAAINGSDQLISSTKPASDTLSVVSADFTVINPLGHEVLVENGIASVNHETVQRATKNSTVTLTAAPAPEGKEFNQWVVVSNHVTLADASADTATFTMPATAVSVKATYTDKIIYTTANVTFKVVNGAWDDKDSTDKTVAVTLANGKGILSAESVPTGMTANAGYENGKWDIIPVTSKDGITGDVTYTYSFTEKTPVVPEVKYDIQAQFVKKSWFRTQITTLTVNGAVTVPVKAIEPIEPIGKPITVTFNLRGWGSHLEGTRSKTMSVTLEPGQSMKAPFVSRGFFGGKKAIVWESNTGLQVTSGDTVHYETLADMLNGESSITFTGTAGYR